MNMNVPSVLLIIGVMASALAAVTSLDQRPNILLLLTDDQDIRLGGTTRMKFYYQHLMQQGTTFRNFFVHTPVCCPSRTSILLGRYLHNGAAKNNSARGDCYGQNWRSTGEKYTFATYAKQAGYRTGYAGKYLNQYAIDGSKAVPPGWDMWLGLVGNSLFYQYSVIQSDKGGPNGTKQFHGLNYNLDYFSDLVANRTLDSIRRFTQSSTSQPFLLVNSWPAPHYPYTPAPWAQNMFPGIVAPRTPNWNASSFYMQQKHWIMRQLSPLDKNLVQRIDNIYRRRQQTLQSVDRHIDQFVRLLADRGVLNNTIIMYTSDNGFNGGQHRLPGDKRHLYENDIRVPFVIRGPNVPRNKVVSDIALNIDIAPTIYQLIQKKSPNQSVPLPNSMDGISILPVIPDSVSGKQPRRNDFLITYYGEGSYPCGLVFCPADPPNNFHTIESFNNTYNCVRTIVTANGTDFIYCRFEDDQRFIEYYDTGADPWQLHNKAFNLSKARVAQLDQRLATLKSCRGATCRQ